MGFKPKQSIIDIATGNFSSSFAYGDSGRVQAIWALEYVGYKNPKKQIDTLLPVFYNRSESSEIRCTVFSYLMAMNNEERVLHSIAYFMWTESDSQISNMVRSTMMSMVNTKSPCNRM